MRIGLFRLSLPYFDEGGGAPGAPAAAPVAAPTASPAGNTGGSPGAPAPGANVGTPAAPAAQPQAQPQGFTYKEDRSNWVPSHVVRQRSEELAKAQRELDYHRRQVAALTGVRPPEPPPNPEHEEVKKQFFQVFPWAKKLEGMVDKLEGLSNVDMNQFQQSIQQSWQVYGHSALRTLTDKAKEIYGSDVTPKTLQRLSRSFATELEHDAEMRERYETGDLTVIDDFLSDYRGTVLDPYRRTSQAQAAAPPRPRLPRGGGSSPVVPAAPALPQTNDPKFHNAAWARFQAAGGSQ